MYPTNEPIVEGLHGGLSDQHRYALVAIDVDGTLIDSQQRLSPGVEEAIRDVLAAGIRVALVSGRPRLALNALLSRLGLVMPFVSSGGAFIADPVTGEVIEDRPLSADDVRAVVKSTRAHGVVPSFEQQDLMFCEADEDVARLLSSTVKVTIKAVPDALLVEGLPSKITIIGEHERLMEVEAELRALNRPLHITYSEPIYLEVTREDVNKGYGLKRLADHLELDLDRVAVIGDAPNDVSMFEIAGLAVAMGNAPAEVKAVADVVAPTNDEDGVAWALRELILRT